MANYYEKIKEFEDELKKTKYNKKTQHHIGLVKAKIAQLKDKEVKRSSGKGKQEGYSVRRSGDATVIMVGFPSSGKSTLLNAITGANSPVGAYEFTTLDVVPGVLEHKESKIQILDVPGIVHGAAMGRGRGKEVLSCLYNADLIMFMVDVTRPEALSVLQKEVYDSNVRVNKRKPDVRIRKTARGGVRVGKTVLLPDLKDATVKSILKEFRINNADITIRSKIDADGLIDVIEGNKRYIPGMIILNKMDLVDEKRLEELKKEIKPDVCISADQEINLEELKDMVFNKLRFIRVYCKEVRKKADMGVPLILQEGATLRTMCVKLHKDFVTKFRFARIWGKSVKFDGQKLLKLKHRLKDKDVVEIHLR